MNFQIEFNQGLFNHLNESYLTGEKIATFKNIDNHTIDVTIPAANMDEFIGTIMEYSSDTAREKYVEKPMEIILDTDLKPIIEKNIDRIQKDMYIHVDSVDIKDVNEHTFTLVSNQTKMGILFNLFFWTGIEYQKTLQKQDA